MNHDESKPTPTDPIERLEQASWVGMKLLGAGAVVAAIAFAVAIVGEDGLGSVLHADIFDISPGAAPDQQQFEDALRSLGHDDPQTYELNGNIVHFSVDYTREDPRRVARRYQEEFVRQNINDRVYDSLAPDAAAELREARLTGQIAPVRLSSDRVVMGGMITENRATDPDELIEQLGSVDDANELFRSHRWVEIVDDPQSAYTKVLATWSDDDFSFENMLPGATDAKASANNPGADPEVPACPGCTRVNQFNDLNEGRGYRSNIFVSPAQLQDVLGFYRRAMQRRGWQESDFQGVHDELREVVDYQGDELRVLSFERDDEKLEIFAYPLEDRNIAVHTAYWEHPQQVRP